MKFAIQASNPRTTCFVGNSDTTLSEAIESIFPLHTEFALLVWNNVYVPLTYKYDVSIIIDDILAMVTALNHADAGAMSIYWPSNTFRARWSLSWSINEVTVTSVWESVIGGTEHLLNETSEITLERQSFLSEWGSLLSTVGASIRERTTGVDLGSELSRLDAALNAIPVKGLFYKD